MRELCSTRLLAFSIIGWLQITGLAQKQSESSDVRIVRAVFAKSLDENDQPESQTTEFGPRDVFYLRVDLNSRPKSGDLSCTFYLGKDEIDTATVDLRELQSVRTTGNAYGRFSIEPLETWPISSDYRAEVRFDGQSLGVFKFAVIEEDKPRKLSISGAMRTQGTQSRDDDGESQTHAAERKRETKEIVRALLNGTAFVEGVDTNGRVWNGTAWLLDAKRKLLVTNDHVANAGVHDSAIGEVKKLQVYFPAYKNGRVVHDASYYARHVDPIPVEVIYGDKRSDLALMVAESLPDERIAEIPLAQQSVELGDSLHSLGGIPAGSEGLWIYTSGAVRAVYQRRLATGSKAQTVEADMQTNSGNSGGPVVNSQGQLVAVVEGHNSAARSVSLYIDLEEVKAFLHKALPMVDPKTAEQFARRGQVHYEASRYDAALKDFTRALRIDPENAHAMASRGWVYYQLDDFKTAVSEFNDAIELDRNTLYAYRGRAMVSFAEGEFETAIEDLTHAIRNSTDDTELAEFYNQRGVAYSRLEDTDSALEDFERAIDADSSHDWAHGNRGNMLIDLGEYDAAIESLTKAAELDSTEPEFFHWLGRASHFNENHEAALKFFDLAIERNETDASFFIERAKCLIELERFEDAGRSLRSAINLDEEDDEVRNEVGLVLFNTRSYQLAYEQFVAASRVVPDNLIYWHNRGLSAFRLREFRVAIADMDKAAALGDDADVYATRGNAHSQLGQLTDANRDFQTAKELRESFRKYNTKYLRIENQTSEALTVWVKYFTKGTDGQSRWYPSGDEGLQYEFVPGEESGLNDGKLRVHGSKFRVWAQGKNSGQMYSTFQNDDLIAVGNAGYVTDQGSPEDERYVFVEKK